MWEQMRVRFFVLISNKNDVISPSRSINSDLLIYRKNHNQVIDLNIYNQLNW